MRKNPPLPKPMIDSKLTVEDFRIKYFLTLQELIDQLGYSVNPHAMRDWIRGRFNPPPDFEKKCKKNKEKLLKYSDWKLRIGVFEQYKKRKPQGFWEREETHRYAFEWLCNKKKWDFPYGLYNLKKDDLFDYNIDGLSNYYKLSPIRMITSIFPEFDWKIWKFQMTPMGYWEDDNNKTEYLKWFEKKFKINKPSDWYETPIYLFEKNYGDTLIRTYFDGSVFNVVRFLYPKIDWDPTRFGKLTFKSQKILFKMLQKIYPNREIEYGYWRSGIKNPKTNYNLELDCYIPSLKIAFEYQGEQHFQEGFFHSRSKSSFKEQKYRDNAKRNQCKKLGITLIEITKKNWDYKEESLRNIINKNLTK